MRKRYQRRQLFIEKDFVALYDNGEERDGVIRRQLFIEKDFVALYDNGEERDGVIQKSSSRI